MMFNIKSLILKQRNANATFILLIQDVEKTTLRKRKMW